MSGCLLLSQRQPNNSASLTYPDTSKPYILFKDARYDYTGACLCQK